MNNLDFRFLLPLLLALILSTGCYSFRHRITIDPAEPPSHAVVDTPYRIVQFRFRDDYRGSFGQETTGSGRMFTENLAKKHPGQFSNETNSVPIIVRQSMVIPPRFKDGEISPSVFDILMVQWTLGLWPATIDFPYEFQTQIQLPSEEYSSPYVWKALCHDVCCSPVSTVFYPESSGYVKGSSSGQINARQLEANRLRRRLISKKTTEPEKSELRESLLWCGGHQINPDILQRGTEIGVLGALASLTPEQREALRNNPIAQYLADEADGKNADRQKPANERK